MNKLAVVAPRYLTAREVGIMFGVSYDTIRRLVLDGRMKPVRIHSVTRYRFTATEILRYVEANEIPLMEQNRRLLQALFQAETTFDESALESASEEVEETAQADRNTRHRPK